MVGRVRADEGLAALAHRRAGQVVELAAGAGDLAETGALGADLAVEVDREAVVDRDHIFLQGDVFDRVDVFERFDRDAGIAVHPFVERL